MPVLGCAISKIITITSNYSEFPASRDRRHMLLVIRTPTPFELQLLLLLVELMEQSGKLLLVRVVTPVH